MASYSIHKGEYMKKLPLILTSLLSVSTMNVFAAGDLERGKALSQSCMGCHGEFGISPIETNPNLAGQNAAYLEYALKAYRSGDRKAGLAVIMRPNAANLSDQDIQDLAAYFSSQPGRGSQ